MIHKSLGPMRSQSETQEHREKRLRRDWGGCRVARSRTSARPEGRTEEEALPGWSAGSECEGRA